MNLSADELRDRFKELTAKHDAIRAKSDPLRATYDKLVQGNRAKEDEAAAKVKAAEAGLAGIETERAMIARALGGKTSAPQPAE